MARLGTAVRLPPSTTEFAVDRRVRVPMRDGVDLGLPLTELAESLDRDEDAVAARAQTLGLAVPPRG